MSNKIKLKRATSRGLLTVLEYGEIAFIKNVSVIVGKGDGTDFTINDYNNLINNPTGTSNQVFGMTATAAGREYKSIVGTTDQAIVTHTAGQIAISTPQSIATTSTPQFARIGIGAAAHATFDVLLNTGTIFSNAIPTGTAYTLDTYWPIEGNLLQLKNNTSTKVTIDANGNILAGKYNNLTLAATATGFTVAEGTSSKTFTTHANFTVGAATVNTGNITVQSSDATARTLTLAANSTINSLSIGNVLYANAADTISGMSGTANQLLGMNNSATLPEFKTLSGTANRVSVSFNTGAITLSGPQDLATTSTPEFLRVGIGAPADATYNLKLNNGTIITNVADAPSAIGFTLETPIYSAAGSKLISIKNDGTEKFSIDKDGVIIGISFSSAGCYPQPTLTDNGDGSCTLGSSEYVFAADAYPIGRGPYRKYAIPGATYTLTDNTMNYIVADYNSGSPIVHVITNATPIDEALIIPVYSIFRYGTELSIQPWDSLAANLANKIHRSIVKTQRYRRQDGLLLSEQTGRYLTLTSGTVYVGATEINLTEINSASVIMIFYYHTAGVWTRTNISVYNNTQYDNGTNLAATSTNNYVVNWVYRGVISNQHLYIVLGTADYAKLSDAQAAQPPALPPEISSDGMLVGKVIVKQGAASATELLSAFTIATSYAVTANHNDLLSLQGGGGGGGIYSHSNQGINTTDSPTFAGLTVDGVSLATVRTITQEPTGFDYPENVVESYDPLSRTISLTGSNYQGYWQGKPIAGLAPGWVSSPHPEGITVPYFLYYNGTSFEWSSTAWNFNYLQIAIVTADSTGPRFAIRESHGLMAWQTHQELHETIGTYITGGGDITGLVFNSITAADRRPVISATSIKDEDIITINPANTSSLYTRFYLTGAEGTANYTLDAADIVTTTASRPYYNSYTGGVWTQTIVAPNDYMTIWMFAIPATADTTSQKYRYLFVQGQSSSSNLANEQALTPNTLYLGNLRPTVPEIIAVGRIIIRGTSNNWVAIQADKVYGTKVAQAVTTGGTYLSGVNTNGTLTGTGTASSPLGVVGVPSPFNVGATAVTTTGTQFNYLNAITGTTGLNTSNLVFSNAPTLVNPVLGAATATSLTAPTVGISGLDSNSDPITSLLTWDQQDGTVQFTLQNGVTGQVFEETFIYGQAFEAIANGDLVMYGGVSGERLLFKKADPAAFGFTIGWVLGVATQSFTTGQLGYITWFGKVHDINTASWATGEIIYMDPNTPGKMTNIVPAAPNPRISVGVVERSAADGVLLVRLRYFHRTTDLADLTLVSLLSNQTLIYDASTFTWKNEYISLAKATFGGGDTSTAIHITNTTSSTTTTTGALIVDGGAGIAENAHIGGDVVIAGNLTVKGTTTSVESTVTSYQDPVITLGGANPPSIDDGKDRGIEFRWHNGSVAKAGFFGFDRSTGKLTYIPDAANTAEVFSGTKGTIDANLEWADVLSKPTTFSGYGITDVYDGTLSLAVSGTGLSGSASFSANQSGNSTFTVTSNATSSNTASTIVARNADGDFSAGIITAALSGNASTATKLATARNFSLTSEATATAVAFDGSAEVALSVTLSNAAVIGKVLTGYVAGTGAVAATDTILQAFQKLGYDQHVAISLATNSGLTLTGQVIAMGTPSSISGISTNAISTDTHTHALTTGYGDGVNPYASKTAKYFLAAPNTGDGVPGFRAIEVSDIPTLNQSTSGQAGSVANATFTTALTVNTGAVTISGNVDNTSSLLLGSGASSISGDNTGDVSLPTDSGLSLTNQSISLGTPSNITGSSTNTVTASTHTHALAIGYGDGVNPYASKTANYILAAPSGSDGTPSFRLLTTADLPALASLALSATSNQLILGTTNTVTISSTAPAASRVYTLPDSGGSGNTIPVTNATPVSNIVVKFTGTAGVITNSIITDDGAGITLTEGSLTAKDGYLFRTSGTPAPVGTTNAVYDGHFYATKFYGDGSSLSGIGASASVADDAASAALYPMLAAGTGTQALKIASTKLFFNAANAKLGIGTVVPSEALSVVGNMAFGPSEGKCKIQYNATEMAMDFIIN